MEYLFPILHIIVGLINFLLVVRAWFQYCRVSTQLPVSQTLLRLTNPVLLPLGRIIPTVKGINFAALFLAALVTSLLFLLVGVPLLQAVIIGLLSVLKSFGQFLFFATLIRALMSWVSQNHPLDMLTAQITEPVLGVIRRILPRTGMLDFSVMVLGVILLAINSLLSQYFGQLWALA